MKLETPKIPVVNFYTCTGTHITNANSHQRK